MSREVIPLTLKTPIRFLPGVGPKMAVRLKKLAIETVSDLLDHFPYRYQDYSLITPIARAQAGETVTVSGNIINIKNIYTRSRKQRTIQQAIVKDQSGTIEIIWFNQPYLVKSLAEKSMISLSGKVSLKGNKLQLISPEFEIIAQEGKTLLNTGQLVPIYPATAGISHKYLRKLLALALPAVANQITEFLPPELINKNKLINEKEAILKIHFPKTRDNFEEAKKRLIFDELFLLQVKLLKEKNLWQKKQPAPILKVNPSMVKKFTQSLPFTLTNAQKEAANAILADMAKPVAMNRLLQGDVGSGKTVVALMAAITAAVNGYQSVFMVPTEILAQQHYKNIKKMLAPFNVTVSLLTGSTSKSNQQRVTSNEQLIIGTHALIHKYGQFKKVGLAIIDEQHRFGVSQRAKLIEKAKLADSDNLSPHILTMTATPIPRTITLTTFGDLDVSTLYEKPEGRKEIKTYLVPNKKRQACYQWIKKNIRQAFFVCPLIDESETLVSVKAAKIEYEKLKKEIFNNLVVDLIHGKMKTKEKEAVLAKMAAGKTAVLVATPIVEVGIDLPEANIMVIETADRFGLAQLHQIRGRVGRSKNQSYCFLFTQTLSQKSAKRLQAMEQTNEGMKLAETDLEIRGPGEIYGTRQHGFAEFKLASYTDLKALLAARSAAEEIIGKDPDLKYHPEILGKIKPAIKKPIAAN